MVHGEPDLIERKDTLKRGMLGEIKRKGRIQKLDVAFFHLSSVKGNMAKTRGRKQEFLFERKNEVFSIYV